MKLGNIYIDELEPEPPAMYVHLDFWKALEMVYKQELERFYPNPSLGICGHDYNHPDLFIVDNFSWEPEE